MDLTYLKNFIEIVKVGCILKASRNLHLSQPAISLQLQKLEKETGYHLIDRDRSHFAITAAGNRFLCFAELVSNEYKKLLYDLSQMEKGTHGKLNILASPILAEFLLPSILSDFASTNPAISINVKISDSLKVLKKVKNQVNTIGFCGNIIEQSGFESVKIGEDEVVLAVYPGHRLYNQSQVILSDLREESLIFRYDPKDKRSYHITSLTDDFPIFNQCKPRLILPTIEGIISAVESKLGIGLVTYLSARKSEAAGLIKIVRIKGFNLRRDLICVYRSDAISNSPYKDFLGFIKSKYEFIN
jgi:DNA-binding transcriptional LysR family regulator